MIRRVVVALVDTEYNGQPFKKGWVIGDDEVVPEVDGKVWGYREVLEADTSEAELDAQRRQAMVGASQGSAGWTLVPGRARPRLITPRGADEVVEPGEVAPAAPVQPKQPAVLGDAAHPWPAGPADDSGDEYQASLERLRIARERIAAENRPPATA
jgi:hypothetical protein